MSEEQRPGLDARASIYGRVESNPSLTHSENGTPRLYFKVRQDHYRYNGGDSYTRLASTYHDVIAFDGAATHGYEQLAKNDWVIAQGRIRENTNPNTGVTEEQFIANRLGHDLARTTYEVDRTPQPTAERRGPEREAERTTGFEAPEPEPVDRDAHARTM
ncbi:MULTISPECIES: single-stranded DNA-binding protein [Brevibacterium]|uniref:single-stranded DNA-binding protein n=1 Tax=Brevibacterium TaxID=1696 RepID=UPI001BA8760B|nr:single-stranded DNA-binding protein [Brevibacterium sp. W7.2]